MTLSILQSLIFAAIQGVTELFPVSSLGHAIIIPALFHLDFSLSAESVLPFLTALHLGTALALLIYFHNDWITLLKGAFTPEKGGLHYFWDTALRKERRTLLLLFTATVPAGLLGLIFEKKVAGLFTNVTYVAVFLIINGLLLFLGEKLRKKQQIGELSDLTYGKAFAIGLAQAAALFPGISRSGMSLIGGLMSGLKHEAAARFSFLLATPIILAAGLLEIPKLFKTAASGMLVPSLVGGITAGIIAYLSTSFLMKYFKKNEVNSLFPFGIYCILLGVISLLVK